MQAITKFIVTEEHLKLMRHFWVGWCYDEFGAPEIDPKRPYGNSDVPGDIAEILGWQGQYDPLRARKIHEDTQIALQIALRVGYFKAGRYKKSNSYSQDWKEVS
jgi:hypothetical protein